MPRLYNVNSVPGFEFLTMLFLFISKQEEPGTNNISIETDSTKTINLLSLSCSVELFSIRIVYNVSFDMS